MKTRHLLAVALVGSSSFVAASAFAAEAWTVKVAPQRSQITDGPWVLSQGTSAFPSPNTGTASMQPYYQSFVTGDATHMVGYFDYRPKSLGESVVAAKSDDGGATWTFLDEVLRLDTSADAGGASDAGEGHPYVLTVGGKTKLYTLDRAGTSVDNLGLFVRDITPTSAHPLSGAPAVATPGSTTTQRTVGLVNPDGILAHVPAAAGAATQVLYLGKDVTVTPNTTTVTLVSTTDGVTFTSPTNATGLEVDGVTWIGPRGTLIKYADGHFGLFYSGGVAADADADAFHFIGYAESTDLLAWTVVHGVNNPLVSIDFTKDPTGGQPWYAGRVYAPNVVFSSDMCSATLVFSGYKTKKVSAAPDDYRQTGYATITRPCGTGADAGADAAAGDAAGSDAAVTDSGTATSDAASGTDAATSTGDDASAPDGGVSSDATTGGDAGAAGTSSKNGCSCTTVGHAQDKSNAIWVLALAGVAVVIGRRRHR